MLDGPLGAAAFNNEFGRPNLTGYFRSFELAEARRPARAPTTSRSCSPAASARSIGRMVAKQSLQPGDAVIVLGGPAMLIGLGGGAASSVASGDSSEDLDFASVQRDNPEMERRCQEVIDRCVALGERQSDRVGPRRRRRRPVQRDPGAAARLRRRRRDRPGQDAQRRSVAVADAAVVQRIAGTLRARPARRNASPSSPRCACASAARSRWSAPRRRTSAWSSATARRSTAPTPHRRDFADRPADGRAVRQAAEDASRHRASAAPRWPELADRARSTCARPACACSRIRPSASKTFLITIGDRTVGGLTARDQMVGPWQLPVADCAITLSGFDGYAGEAMAIGERTPLALLDAAAAARMAVGEAITNLCAAPVESLERIKLSANWMAAAGHPGEDARAVRRGQGRRHGAVPGSSTSASRSARTRCRCRRSGMRTATAARRNRCRRCR